MRKNSFPLAGAKTAKVLILGSMPGEMSLSASQYYAHPRNAFWHIMGDLFGAGVDIPYEKRLKILEKNKIALWDVLASCIRNGSLDSAIIEEEVNDFSGLLQPGLTAVFFNGRKAEQIFKRYVKTEIPCFLLPSTSPAHAGRSLAEKLQAWRLVKDVLERD